MVLPVHDENPLRRSPWVTYALVAANDVVLLLTPASRDSVTGPSAQAQVCGFLAGLVVGLLVRAASPPPQYPVHPRYR